MISYCFSYVHNTPGGYSWIRLWIDLIPLGGIITVHRVAHNTPSPYLWMISLLTICGGVLECVQLVVPQKKLQDHCKGGNMISRLQPVTVLPLHDQTAALIAFVWVMANRPFIEPRRSYPKRPPKKLPLRVSQRKRNA